MSSRDVFSYFKLYSPRNIEWVNDSSCELMNIFCLLYVLSQPKSFFDVVCVGKLMCRELRRGTGAILQCCEMEILENSLLISHARN